MILTAADAVEAYKSNDGWEFADREAAWRWMFDRGHDAAQAEILELKTLLHKIKERCLFADDGSIGITQDAHIPQELFDEIVTKASSFPRRTA